MGPVDNRKRSTDYRQAYPLDVSAAGREKYRVKESYVKNGVNRDEDRRTASRWRLGIGLRSATVRHSFAPEWQLYLFRGKTSTRAVHYQVTGMLLVALPQNVP